MGGGLVALTAFASCDNFLAGADVKKEIEETIAYNNAKDINVLIMPEIGTGTIVQNTNYTAKLGYPFEISFTEAAEYSFVEWIAVDKNNPETRLNDGVSFDDAHSATTKVKISTSSVAVKIIPSCEKRIALAVEPSPRYDPLGVSRDRSITVTFTKTLNKSSFIYEENEIPAGAQIKKNEDGEIWAYTFDGQTYLKNISITNADDYSIADHFTCPLVNDKLLTIAVDKNEPIKFNSGEIFKTVKVTLSKDICDNKGIKMNTEKSWNYQITESTDDKASVNLTSDKGSVYLAGTKDYSIGQKITLALTEDADYQFVRWDYDSSIIYLAEPTNPNTTATVLEKTQGENTTQIKAICAPRLRVLDKGFSPLNDSENPTVSKNSSIVITFNQNLPDDEEGKKQLENISITIGGSPVNSSFKTPVINENTVTFVADNSNMLDVPAGQTKTVSVTVPADLYYKLADGTKVSYGANGISFNYKIDETTLDKAEITFSAATGSGTLKGASGTGNYSIGQEVSLVFEPADGWQFNGWSVTCGGEAVPETQIKIADKNALSTKLTVYEALAGLLVTAKTSECLSFTANPSAAVNPKDSEIQITFNKNLASDCASLLDKILINSGDLDDYYATRVLEGNTITIKNTSPLSVAKDTTKLITVTVPSDFYYMNDGIKVNLERKSFSFKVDHTTNAKTKVTYSVINGENDSAFNPSNAAGSIEGLQTNLVQYNIGEEVPLSFALADGYQFYGWKITDANGNLVTDTVSYKNNTSASSLQPTLVMNKPAEGLKISAVCYKRPSISTSTVTPYNANSVEEVAKNKSIVLNFAHKIMSETKDAIIVNYSAISNFNKNTYFSTSISEDEKTVTLKPIKMLPLNNSYETVTVTVPHDKVYYLASDGKTKITPSDEDFTWSYKINSSTEKQTEVRFATTDAAQIGRQINVGDTLLSSGSKQKLNIEQTVKLEYPIAEPDKYKFAGWKVSPATSGYTVTPASYVTSGSITVKNESDTYFTLIVDSDDPTKASITSSAFMSNGTDGYGITVSAKDVELPSISTFSPSAAVNPKDSEIKITFNKNLASDCASLLDKILINSGDLDDYYAERVLDGNTITIKNTSPLSVAKDTTKLITVTVPSDFYYMNDGIKVNLERKSFSFKVDHTTNAKTKVTYSVINGEGGAVLSAAGSIEDVQSNCQYNIGEEVSLSFAPASGYQFYGWKITDANGNLVTDTVSYKNNTSASSLQPTLVMNKPAEGLKISAVCYKRPKVTTLSPYSSESNKEFAKNTPISLTFAHAIKEGTEQYIEIKYSVSSFSQSTYFSRSLSSDHTKVLFTPIKMLPVENAFETVTVTVPHDKVYYLAADGKTKITTSDEDFSWSYKINSSTEEQTEVRFATTDAAQTGRQINVGETLLSSGTKQKLNIEQSVNLEYPIAEPNKYKFAGWKVTPAISGYTVTPASYVTSGSITVTNGNNTYFTLIVDSNNPNKATITSSAFMSNGTDGYGITVSAKDVELPNISTFSPAAASNAMDSTITITFDKALASACSSELNQIHITMDGNTVDDFFETRTLSGKTITIKNTKSLGLTGTTTKTIAVTIPPVFYYEKDGLNVYIPESKTYTYVIDSTTTAKTKLRFYPNESSYKKLNVNGTETNNGAVGTYNMGETVNLEYPLPSDYRFLGWKISPYSSAYSVSSTDYLSKGTITVTKGGQTYFTLKINDNDPTKATATCSYGTISGSSYGLTIMTKDTVIPKIVSITPEYKELGVRCDSPITITFNKEMDKTTLVLDDTILIPNPDGSNSPKGYGFVRSFADIDESSWNGNKLTLKPRKGSDCSYYIRGADVADVTVKLVSTRIKDTYGFMLSSENTTYTYRINKEKETTKPTVTSLGVFSDSSKTHSYTSQAENYWKSTQDGDYKYGDYSRNHAGGSFYFSVTGYDDDSGLKKLVIKETLLTRDSWTGQLQGVNATSDPNDKVETEYNLSDLTLAGTETKNGHTYYTYTGTHEMKCLKDGFFDVAFSFTDVVGNISYSNSLHLIKDTKIDESVIKFTEFASDSAITQRSETNSGDKVVMTFDETAKDAFLSFTYGRYTSTTVTYDSDFDISVKWGYAEDSITNTATKSGNQFSFTRDATKLTFVKIICKDEVNNVKEIIRIIPPRPDYDSTCINYSQKNSGYTGRIFKITPFSYSSLKTLASFYDAELELYMSRQINTSSTYTDVVSWNEDDSRLLNENCYYFLRPIYVLKYKDGSAWYSSINSNYRAYIYLEQDVTSSSSVPRAFNILPSVNTTSTSPTIPSSVHVDIEFLWNTGLCKVMIDESGLDSNWNWSYKLVNYYDDTQIETFNTPTFYVSCPRPAPNKYSVYFIAKRKSDGYVYTKSSGVNLSTQCVNDVHKYGTTGYNNILDLENDVNPPSFANAVHHVEYNSIIYTKGPADDKAMYAEKGKGVIECYLAPNVSKTVTDFDNYTLEELENSSFTKITAKYSDVNNIIIPLDGINEGFYTACVVAKDSYGNKAVECFPLEHKYRLDYPYTITVSGSTGAKLYATFLNYKYNTNTAHSFYNYNSTNHKWMTWSYFSTPGFYTSDSSKKEDKVTYNPISSTETLPNCWIKIVGQVNSTYSSAAVYTQVDYIYTPNLIGSVTCNQKNVLQGLNGLQIFCDKPTLVHTFYSSEKITETANQDDILKWEMLGVETGITTNSSNFTYGSENFEEIPAGYYYTTVVHFADGTTVMSDVKQK